MAANQTTNNNSIRSILDKEKLNGSNFLDWYRNMRIFLRNEQKLHHIGRGSLPLSYVVSMTPEIQKNLEDRTAFEIQQDLKTMFQKHAEQELFEIVKAFHACKQEEGQSVSTYVLKMKAYLDQIERLGYPMPLVLGGLRGIQKMNKGALDLYVGNGNCAVVEAIWSFDLTLPSRMQQEIQAQIRFYFSMALSPWPHKQEHIAKMQHDGLLESTDDESFDVCVSCISRKMARKPFTHASKRAGDLLGLIHSDVCGPFRTMSREGANYYVTFTDDFSRYGYVYLMKHNHEVFEMFKTFQNEVENQLKKTLKALRSDRGGKYLSQEFLDHLRSRGIISKLTPPYTPQHNGVSERRNQTLLDMVRSMMSLTTLPMSFWGYALESAARILNMVLTKKVNKTPYEMWYEKVPNLSYLKVWGYPKETMSYYFYYLTEKKLFVARYVEFFESNLISQEASGSAVDIDEIQRQDEQPLDNTSEHQPEDEYNDVDPQTATIGSKWLFKKKTDMDGNIHTNKAHLVAKGFSQTYGVNYAKTFSPVADIKAIRILIAIAAYYDYEIWQMDVKTAFLNGRLNKDVYMVQPKGFVNPKHPRQMDTSKRGVLMQPNVDLSKAQGPFTPAEVMRMKGILMLRLIQAKVTRLLKYLRNTKDIFLVYGAITELRVTCYTDVSWETDRDDLRSQTGYVFMMNGGTVDWKSSKQSTTAMSSIEAEYIATSKAAMEAIWIRKFIAGLGVVPNNDRPMDMYCDNTAAITISNEPSVQKGAKHFRRKYHFVREVIQEAGIRIRKVHTYNNLADPFTKPMSCTKHVEHARNIELRPAGSFM
ncbi:retrotransposon protein, putative, ty1-copia subclass [Tanacetum coccineum]